MKYAVAVLDIKPMEFWELTLAEYNVMIDAYEWRVEQEMWQNAQMASWMLMPHYKEPITASQLMGVDEEEDEEEKQPTTKDDIEDMKKRMGL